MWQCPKCREEVEDNFEICWNCGSSPAGALDPSFKPAVERKPFVAVCGACGYDLRGISSDRCPECGAPIDRRPVYDTADNADASPRPARASFGMFRLLFWLVVIFFVVAWAASRR